jgi:hypothetical protein
MLEGPIITVNDVSHMTNATGSRVQFGPEILDLPALSSRSYISDHYSISLLGPHIVPDILVYLLQIRVWRLEKLTSTVQLLVSYRCALWREKKIKRR